MFMPRRQKIAISSFEKTLQYGSIASRMLYEISEATSAPYLKAIAGISLLIIETVQAVRSNRQECVRMTEQTYHIVCTIINLCADSPVEIPQRTMRIIEEFTGTIQKILSYVRIQAEGSVMKRLLHHMEIASLLSECNKGLNHAMIVFEVQSHVNTAVSLAELQAKVTENHREIMTLLNDSMNIQKLNKKVLTRSNSNISIIPASPKIFYGRDSELQQIVIRLVTKVPSYTAILGHGGIGKTSLALAVLHNVEISSHFGAHRYFIKCDAIISAAQLLSMMVSYFHVDGSQHPASRLKKHLDGIKSAAIVVLDNLESVWDIPDQKLAVEDTLSMLADVRHLSIVITMRGLERPSKIPWTRPLFPPLLPLDDYSTRQIFIAISDVSIVDPDLPPLLSLTDNLPLAVTLMANLAAYESCAILLLRWNKETTSLISDGSEKTSNLEMSISVSLSSPRIVSVPESRELLSILALLPDGMSDTTLRDMEKIFPEILKLKSALCRVSIAHIDQNPLKVLAPVREYIRREHPPSPKSLHFLQVCFYGLVHDASSPLFHSRAYDDVCTGNRTLMRPYVEALGDKRLSGTYFLALSKVVDEKQSRYYVETALDLFTELGDRSMQAAAQRRLLQHYFHNGMLSACIEDCHEMLSPSNQDIGTLEHSHILRLLSQATSQKGNTLLALKFATKARHLAQIAGSLYWEARCRVSLLQSSSTALTALGLYDAVLQDITAQQAGVHYRMSEYDDAKKLFYKLLEMGPSSGIYAAIKRGLILHNLVEIDILNGDEKNPRIQKHLETCRAIFTAENFLPGMAAISLNESQLCFKIEQLEEAKKHLSQCMNTEQWSNSSFIMQCFELLGDIEIRQENKKKRDAALYDMLCTVMESIKFIEYRTGP
ncbi:hypothetical protein BDQ12DRAFT_713653 [Crucibulum laeve]|uniref:Novel STAND NTPase 1 domain-containing protein n=1 Tax=Crucibulum laeve TaxID=68775 RepID=A0A5C3LYX6_9AGAR|nr:hypothetical protein BDQ12DRAFT_713653 [Crucibulum laeve]